MSIVMMKCGHTATAVDEKGNPVCASCFGIVPEAIEIAEMPSLEGRKAECCQCDNVTDSRIGLPFFSYRPDKETDLYYCGCWGWD